MRESDAERAHHRKAVYRRHDLVRVDPAAWRALLAGRSDLAGLPHLSGWAVAGHPLIVRRFLPGESRTQVPLGLPLPPADGKRRIAFTASAEHLATYTGSTLHRAGVSAPRAWQPTLDALTDLGEMFGLVPRPFGSLLWQAATGLPYLTQTSDLDLLWPLADLVPPQEFLDRLAELSAEAPMRLDGELLLPDGGGVHWRELFEAPAEGEVLVKYLDHLELRRAVAFRERAAA